MQPSDEIKSRLDIVDIIKEYIQLKPVGSNFSALSPFNREKTPSFIVSPEKQIWHCFSSGKGGDIITFIMEIEGVNFVEALRILAPKAGVSLRRQNPEMVSRRNRLLDIMEVVSNFYHQNLLNSKNAEVARKYLKERQLTDETLIDWKIGFSIDSWDDAVNVLKKRGYKDNEIIEAGLANKKKEGYGIYNRFRDRVMFPISDINGNIVAFSARIRPDKEDGSVMGKYINSPQTLIYNKSRIVFGLDKAKLEIKNNNLAVIVEGQMDVVTAHQNGFKNVVASSGTALTNEQIKLIKRYTNNIAFAFDMDNAGQIATDRAIRESMAMDMNIRVIVLPSGKDPDDFLKKNPEKWKELVEKADNVMSYYFDKVFSNIDINNVEGKRDAVRNILPIINRLKSLVEKDFWLKQLSQKIDIEERYLRETLASIENKKISYVKKETMFNQNQSLDKNKIIKKELSNEEKKSEFLISFLIKFPIFLEYASKNIDINLICGDISKLLYNNLIIYYNTKNSDFKFDEFKEYLNNEALEDINERNNQLKLLNKLVVFGERRFEGIKKEDAKNEILNILISIKREYLRKAIKTTEKQLKVAEKNNNDKDIEILMLKLKKIFKELKKLDS